MRLDVVQKQCSMFIFTRLFFIIKCNDLQPECIQLYIKYPKHHRFFYLNLQVKNKHFNTLTSCFSLAISPKLFQENVLCDPGEQNQS